jgi:hypothetical protein
MATKYHYIGFGFGGEFVDCSRGDRQGFLFLFLEAFLYGGVGGFG